MSYLKKVEQWREWTRLTEELHKCNRSLASSAGKVYFMNKDIARLEKSIAEHEALVERLSDQVTDEICKAVV